MKRRILIVSLLLICLTICMGTANDQVNAATDEGIEQAVADGVAWLASQQDPTDGNWGDYEEAAHTCFALVKLQERAYDLGMSPFEPAYEYSGNVIRGWQYIFGVPHVHMQSPLPTQTHGTDLDDPDTNANGYGLFFDTYGSHPTYTTGICLMALAASEMPDRKNDGGLDFDSDSSADTFQEIAQEAADWLAFGQADISGSEGGWGYGPNDNANAWADNSNSGYAVLGLAYAEGFGAKVPDWVKDELGIWIDHVQCTTAGAEFGGSGYSSSCGDWVNQLKTGNLIFEMTYVGDTPGTPRFDNALQYIESHWQDPNTDPGWGFNQYPANYQAMYTLMKGFEYSGVDLIALDGDSVRDDDWFNQEPPAPVARDFASVIVAQQNGDGSWPVCNWGDSLLCTTWALLTLEKVSPPPPNQPPDCSNAMPSQESLWPPNHNFVPIDILDVTDPDGDDFTIKIESIFQDEPVDTDGDGKFVPDGTGIGTSTAEVRAERAGTKKVPGDGRVYHIFFTATDDYGDACEGAVSVIVPHNVGAETVDGGPIYDSTGTSSVAPASWPDELTPQIYLPAITN